MQQIFQNGRRRLQLRLLPKAIPKTVHRVRVARGQNYARERIKIAIVDVNFKVLSYPESVA